MTPRVPGGAQEDLMLCQLQCLEGAVIDFTMMERLAVIVKRKAHGRYQRARGLFSSQTECPLEQSRGKKGSGDGVARVNIPPLNLKEGEMVRVKSFEDIMATLDEENKFQGLAFTPVTMRKYCGGTYRVLKRVEKIFDERKWKLSKIKNVVLLDGVYCDGAGGIQKDWDGCDRLCFIWWKEGWLERASK
jgi:hypothetical protein